MKRKISTFGWLLAVVLLLCTALQAQSLRVRGSVQLASCTAVDASATHAYITGGGSFAVVSLFNPDAPTILGQVATGAATVHALAADAPYVYGAGDAAGLVIMNVASPANPALITRYTAGSPIKGVAVHDTLVAIATPTFVALIGVRDRAHPHLRASYGHAAAWVEFDAGGRRLHCGSATGAFELIINGPTGPDSTLSLTAGGTYGSTTLGPLVRLGNYTDLANGAVMVVLNSNYGFVAQMQSPLAIRAISSRDVYAFVATATGVIQWATQVRQGLPELQALATLSAAPTGIASPQGNLQNLVVVSTSSGMTVLNFDTSTSAAQEIPELPAALELVSYPNPFNSVTDLRISVERPGFYTLRIFDPLGREVESRKLALNGSTVERLDFSGHAGGIYFARLEGVKTSVTRKLLFIP